jgi:hypothetical protein
MFECSDLYQTGIYVNMKNFLLLNDFSPQAERALAVANVLANQFDARVLIWNINRPEKSVLNRKMALSASSLLNEEIGFSTPISAPASNNASVTYLHEEETYNRSIHEVVVQYKVQLIIKGVTGSLNNIHQEMRSIVAKTFCPLLLVPEQTAIEQLKHLVYIDDLRFCRSEIVSYLKQATTAGADVTVAHIATKGIPDMVDDYAKTVYQEAVGWHSPHIRFNHIKEKNIKKAADVLVNMMNTNMLVMAYDRFHLAALTNTDGSDNYLKHLPVPLMVFPS